MNNTITFEINYKMMFHIFDVESVLKNIICIKNNNQIIPFQYITFQHNIFIDGQKLSKRSSIKVEYNCPNCNNTCITRLTTLSDKLKRGYKGCKYCFHHQEIQEVQPKAIEMISNEYFKKQLTLEEFERIKKHITSFQNKFTLDDFTYIPIMRKGNDYNCFLYDNTRRVYEEVVNLECKCEQCSGIFKVKYLHHLKNQHKIICNLCKRIKTFKFGINHGVFYKNKFEKKFIDMCIVNGIKIENKDGNLYIPDLDKKVVVQHKKFKSMECKDVLYSDELVEQLNIIKKQINENHTCSS